MFYSWLDGVLIVFATIAVAIMAGMLLSPAGAIVAAVVMIVALLVVYIRSYIIAWASIPISSLEDSDGTPPGPVMATAVTANVVGGAGEFNSRAFMIGMNATFTGTMALGFGVLDPTLGIVIAVWDFVIVSLSASPAVSTNRVFQGLLGWTGWISPTSLLASVFGLLGFVTNLPFAIASAIASGSGTWWPVRLDWTSGVVETTGGGLFSMLSVPGALGGTVGHFSFVLGAFGSNPATFQGTFTPTGAAPANTSAHEVGHSLDYVAFGGIRNLIAAVDQLVFGNRSTAYTELTADSHVPTIGRFQVRMWS